MKEQKSAPSDHVLFSSTSDAKPTQKKRSESPKSEENRSSTRYTDLLDSLYSSVNKSKDSKKNHGTFEEDGDGDEEKSSVAPSPKTEPARISAKPKTADRAKHSDGPQVKHPNTKKKIKQPNPNSDSPKSRSPSGKVTLCNNVFVSC